MQGAQKGYPARPQRVKARGGTYRASLEPLASITCERIGTLPPVGLDRYVEGLNDARTLLADFFSALLIARWFEVARWAVLPGNRGLFGLFDETTQIHLRCTEQLRFAALHDSGQQDVQRTIHP